MAPMNIASYSAKVVPTGSCPSSIRLARCWVSFPGLQRTHSHSLQIASVMRPCSSSISPTPHRRRFCRLGHQRRGQNYPRPRTWPPTCKPPLSPVRCEPWLGGLLGLSCFAPLQPSLERGATFCRLLAKQQSVDADILIELRPMNSIPCTADLKIGALGRCAMRQTRIPADGHSDRAPIFEVDRQG